MVLCATCIQVFCIKFLVRETWTVCHGLKASVFDICVLNDYLFCMSSMSNSNMLHGNVVFR